MSPMSTPIHGSFNSSITASAHSLCVPVEAVAAFVHNWETGRYLYTQNSEVEALVEQMAHEVSRFNPTLVQRWRLLKVLREKQNIEP